MKKTNIYQDKKNLHEFFKENHYVHQKFVNESSQKVYKVYENFKESYSEIFTDINMIIIESTYYYYECKTCFIFNNKLHNHIHTECKSLAQSDSAVLKNSKSTIIKSVIKSKKLFKYSFKK